MFGRTYRTYPHTLAGSVESRDQGLPHAHSLSLSLSTPTALSNPTAQYTTIVDDMFDVPMMAGIVTDQHFSQRDRMGRLVASLPRNTTKFQTAAAIPTVILLLTTHLVRARSLHITQALARAAHAALQSLLIPQGCWCSWRGGAS